MAIEQVTSWRTSDAKLWVLESDAARHEAELTAKKGIEMLVEKECYSGMDKDAIAEMIYENIFAITMLGNTLTQED